jgi:hypothetical protein
MPHCVGSEAGAKKPVQAACRRQNRISCQKTFTTTLTGQRGSAYKPPIDAAANANGAQIFLRNRAVGPDFGREQKLFCGGLFLSVASKDVLFFDK